MFKGWNHILCAVAAVGMLYIGAVTCDECLYQFELWDTQNPNQFYYCHPVTKQPTLGDCPANKGFVRNETVTGCVPWLDWNDACVNKADFAAYTCGEETFLQPYGAANPGVFYLCTGQGDPPVQLKCPDDRGFYAKNHYLGCFPWDMWRNLTQCTV